MLKTKQLSALAIAAVLSLLNLEQIAAQNENMIMPPPGASQSIINEFNQGGMLLNAGKYAEAVRIYERVCKELPAFAEAHQMYGAALLKLSRANEAELELKKALELKPDLPAATVNLGSVYQMQGKYEKAVAEFEKYLKAYPNGQNAGMVRAMVNALKTETARSRGVESSKGKDNYLSESLALGAARWPSSKMPLKIQIKKAVGVKGYKSEYLQVLKDAFSEWQEASQNKISFKFIDDENGDSDISCTWLDDPNKVINPAEGGQAIVAPDVHGNLSTATIKLLTLNPNFPDGITEASLKVVCLHEIGHALGVLGHSSENTDVMFTTLNPVVPLKGLSARDKNTVVALYNAPVSIFSQHRIKRENASMLGSDNPQNRALQLNSEAVSLCERGDYAEALPKLEEAMKLTPDDKYVCLNMGNVFGHLGKSAYDRKDFAIAEMHLKKAAGLYARGGRKDLASTTYENLAMIARSQGHANDASSYQAQSNAMKK